MKERAGIIKDPVSLEVYTALHYATACEDCTHFDPPTLICTLGYPTEPHLRKTQIHDLKTIGKVAFCRAQEID